MTRLNGDTSQGLLILDRGLGSTEPRDHPLILYRHGNMAQPGASVNKWLSKEERGAPTASK